MSCAITAGRRFLTFIMRMSRGEDRQPSRSPKTRRGGLPSSVISSRRFMCSPRARIRPYHGYVKAGLCDTAKLQGQCPLWVRSRHQDIFAMSALSPKADIGTGTCITFDAATPAAWRYSPRSFAPRRPSEQCPLYPRKRTLIEPVGMSALCQKQTFCVAAKNVVIRSRGRARIHKKIAELSHARS